MVSQCVFNGFTVCVQWFQSVCVCCLPLSGSSSKITEQNLKGSDIDSDALKLSYVLTSDPASGTLLLNKKKVSVKGPAHSFTQEDVNKGRWRLGMSDIIGLPILSADIGIKM